MKVSIRTISVEWNGEIKGLDFVMCCAAQYCSADLGFNEADRLSEDLDRLTRQLMELAWICRRFAESGVYFGYILDVSIARSGISVMRFRKMEEGPTPPFRAHPLFRHSLVLAMLLLLIRQFFLHG